MNHNVLDPKALVVGHLPEATSTQWGRWFFSIIKEEEGCMPGTDIPLGKQQIWKPGTAIFKGKLIGLRAWVNKRQHPWVTRENRQPLRNSSTFSWVWLVCYSSRATLWLCLMWDVPKALHDSQTLCQQSSHTGSLQTPWRVAMQP